MAGRIVIRVGSPTGAGLETPPPQDATTAKVSKASTRRASRSTMRIEADVTKNGVPVLWRRAWSPRSHLPEFYALTAETRRGLPIIPTKGIYIAVQRSLGYDDGSRPISASPLRRSWGRDGQKPRRPSAAKPGRRQKPEDAFAFSRSPGRSEEHTSELQSLTNLVCRLLLGKKNRHSSISR